MPDSVKNATSFSGFGVALYRPTAITGYICWVRGTEPIVDTEQSGNRGGLGRNETNYKNNKTENVSSKQ